MHGQMVKTSVHAEVVSFVCPGFQMSITHIFFFASRVKMNGILFVVLTGFRKGYRRISTFPSDAVFLLRPLHAWWKIMNDTKVLNVETVYTGHDKNLRQNMEKEIYEFWQDTLKKGERGDSSYSDKDFVLIMLFKKRRGGLGYTPRDTKREFQFLFIKSWNCPTVSSEHMLGCQGTVLICAVCQTELGADRLTQWACWILTDVISVPHDNCNWLIFILFCCCI